MKLIKGKIYFVQWVDTFNVIGWRDLDEVQEQCKKNKEWINTVGFYLGYSHGYELFAGSFTPIEEMKSWNNITAIPKGVIKKLERL